MILLNIYKHINVISIFRLVLKKKYIEIYNINSYTTLFYEYNNF